ncbi:MAG: hypothetical protein E6Q24_05110 [Chitinophagaceae bacterium]|nr:MAG: hypothetical protein E6Q24_05110 [Chitinophagaceae bacterium]
MHLLEKILPIQSPSYQEEQMIQFIKAHCRALGCKVWVNKGNVYITKGKASRYPCMVAHTDTVFDFIPQEHLQVYYYEDKVFGVDTRTSTLTGLGMDDKIGIWIALKMLEEQDHLKCFFPHAEEVGAHGSAKAAMSFFRDVAYCIQCDRMGNSDLVTEIYGTKICSDQFLNDIGGLMGKFGYKPSTGALTDVYQLVINGINKSCINTSTGYYNPHQMDEYIEARDIFNTLDFIRSILALLGDKTYDLPRSYSKHAPYATRSYYTPAYSKPVQAKQDNNTWEVYDCCSGCGHYTVIVEDYFTLCQACYDQYYADLFFTYERKSRQNLEESSTREL